MHMTEDKPQSNTHKIIRYSVSEQMFELFKKHKKRRQVVSVVYVLVYLIYMAWRLTTLNPDSMPLSLTYYVAECFGFILGLTIIVASQDYNHRIPKPVLENRSVDVLIPTYKEPIEVIRQTAISAKSIDYQHGTFILDDGRREEVKELAAELGINYLSRPNNEHAKAGNLNYGLAHSKAEFVMVFDADHIAMPHALDVTLGFFVDEAVAMVQTPQDYYNTNAFQYINSRHGGLWHDQSSFYNIGQSCVDSSNSSSGVGTGVVYRRSALDAIGGVPTTTITEDIHTSIKFHKADLQVVYLNEPIAYGEAAPDLKEYYKTRHRWGHGNLHALQHENILFCKGLSLRQRISYFALGLIHLEGWQQLLLFTIPIATLTLGWQPFEISIFNILVVLLFPIFNYMLLQELGCGFARFWANEIFAMARWPVHLVAVAGLLGRPMVWRTSLKNIKSRVHFHLILPQIIVLVASVGALIYAFIKVRNDFHTGPLFAALQAIILYGTNAKNVDIFAKMPKGYTVDLVIIAGFWALYNATRAAAFIIKVINNAKDSHKFFRFKIPLIVQMALGDYGKTKVISETWIGLSVFDEKQKFKIGQELSINILLPAGKINLRIIISKIKKSSINKSEIEGHFIWDDGNKARDILSQVLYSVDWQREFLNRHATFLTPIDFITACITFDLSKLFKKKKHWNPVLYIMDKDDNDKKLYGVMSEENPTQSFITFADLPKDSSHKGLVILDNEIQPIEFTVIGEEMVSSLVQKGLDGAVVRKYLVEIASVA